MRYAVSGATLLLLACGIYAATMRVYCERAARSDALAVVERALRYAPGNAELWIRRAELQDQAGRDCRGSLARAAALKPLDPALWIQLGLEAERRSDFTRAEQNFLHAAQLSRLYETRWAVANYYFRRGSAADFWRYARQALEITARSPDPVFRLCWHLSRDPAEILRRAVPPRHEILAAYAAFLTGQNQLDAAAAVAQRFAPQATPGDLPALLNLCNRLLDAKMLPPAMAVWNSLCRREILGCRPLDPAAGVSLTDGAFLSPAPQGGFSWRTPAVPGISAGLERGLATVAFSGDQPEACETLTQLVPVNGRRNAYELRFQYRTSDIPPHSGLRWNIIDVDSGTEIPAASPDLSGAEWRQESVRFAVPAGARLLRLALSYTRVPGTVRVEGSVFLRKVDLVSAP